MSADAWMNLWMALLWGSAVAFFLVTLYIVLGWLRRLYIRAMGGPDTRDDG